MAKTQFGTFSRSISGALTQSALELLRRLHPCTLTLLYSQIVCKHTCTSNLLPHIFTAKSLSSLNKTVQPTNLFISILLCGKDREKLGDSSVRLCSFLNTKLSMRSWNRYFDYPTITHVLPCWVFYLLSGPLSKKLMEIFISQVKLNKIYPAAP